MTAATTLSVLIARADALAREFEVDFAGYPRATRSLVQLGSLLERARAVLAELEAAVRGPQGVDAAGVRERVARELARYEDDARAIVCARAAGEAHGALA